MHSDSLYLDAFLVSRQKSIARGNRNKHKYVHNYACMNAWLTIQTRFITHRISFGLDVIYSILYDCIIIDSWYLACLVPRHMHIILSTKVQTCSRMTEHDLKAGHILYSASAMPWYTTLYPISQSIKSDN